MSENPNWNPKYSCIRVKLRGHSLYPYSGPSWANRLGKTIILLYQMVHNCWEPGNIGQKEHFGLGLGYRSVRRLKKTLRTLLYPKYGPMRSIWHDLWGNFLTRAQSPFLNTGFGYNWRLFCCCMAYFHKYVVLRKLDTCISRFWPLSLFIGSHSRLKVKFIVKPTFYTSRLWLYFLTCWSMGYLNISPFWTLLYPS